MLQGHRIARKRTLLWSPSQAQDTGPGFLPTSRTNGKKNQRLKKKFFLNGKKKSDSYISVSTVPTSGWLCARSWDAERRGDPVLPSPNSQSREDKLIHSDSAHRGQQGSQDHGLYAPTVPP